MVEMPTCDLRVMMLQPSEQARTMKKSLIEMPPVSVGAVMTNPLEHPRHESFPGKDTGTRNVLPLMLDVKGGHPMESVRHLSTQELVGIYERIKTIAVVGASADGSKTANAKPASRRMVRWQLRVARPGRGRGRAQSSRPGPPSTPQPQPSDDE